MVFRPRVDEKITIDSIIYQFTEHPSAPKIVYGQTGRRATVYQVQTESKNLRALKVFTVAWRDSRNALSAQMLGAFSSLPGLQVCHRHVITPQSHSGLLAVYPELEYAVLMDWVSGETWQEVIMNGHPFSPKQSQAIARSFGEVLARMEHDGLAHCDLSGPNVLIKLSPAKVELVDVEDLFGPGLERPAKVGGGSSGYAHKTAPAGLWDGKADRFAGAVLLAEMLGWCDERVRRIAYGEQFFDPDEVQHGTERYQVLHQVLKERWGNDVAGAFAKAWYSETLDECPPFQEWQFLLNTTDEQRTVYRKVAHARSLMSQGQFDEAIKELEAAHGEDHSIAFPTLMDALVKRADRNFHEGKLEDALKDYRTAQEIAPQGQSTQLIEQGIKKVQDAFIALELNNAEDMLANGQLEPALVKLKELYGTAPALAADPYAKALLARGFFKEGKGDLLGAEKDYLTALSIASGEGTNADLDKALENLKLQMGIQKVEAGEKLLAEDQFEQAVLKLEEAYQTVPDQAAGAYARALFTWGAQKEREGNKESALQDYRKAFQVAPEGGLRDELGIIVNEFTLSVTDSRERSSTEKETDEGQIQTKKEEVAEKGISQTSDKSEKLHAESDTSPFTPLISGKDKQSLVSAKKSEDKNPFFIGGIILIILFVILIRSCGLQGNSPTPVETATTTPTTKKATQPLQNTAASVALSESFELLATDGERNTGIKISEGDLLTIHRSSGLWSPYPGSYFNADGDPDTPAYNSANIVQWNCPHGALIGRIGYGSSSSFSFCIGEDFSQYMDYQGYLYLSINDNVVADDSGSITVKISVQSQSTGSTTQSTVAARTPTKTATKTSTSVPTKTATKTSTPVPNCDPTNNCYEVEVSAKTLWLGTKVQATKGDRIVIEYVSGKWRAGSDDWLIWTDANGYPGTRPSEYCPWCTAPILEGTLGQLVAKIAEQKAVHTIGNGGEFVAEANGILCLMMNDIYYSFDDNSGSVTVRILVNP